jgi:hypothetical protein
MQNIPKLKPEQRGISDNVDPNDGSALDLTELAKSPYGDLEVTKYLYESGLQNIFNSYQQNVATLSQNKQKELQDAYYIREMSRKYLGEYASNVGIGDVSGNLLDIYGQYQSNLSTIEREYGSLEMGLQQEFQQKRQDTMNKLLMTQYDIEVEKLDEKDRSVIFNIEMGNIPEGMTDMEYLQQEFDAGRISRTAFETESANIMKNQRTTEERQIFGQLVRGEITKEELTDLYNDGKISPEAYSTYFSVMEEQGRSDAVTGIEFNIQQNRMGGLGVRDFLQQQLDNGIITEPEYMNLITKYAGDPRTELANEIAFNIANGSIPEGFGNAIDYIEGNKEQLGVDVYRSLIMNERIKQQQSAGSRFVQFEATQPEYDVIDEQGQVKRVENKLASAMLQFGINDLNYLTNNEDLPLGSNIIFHGPTEKTVQPYIVDTENSLIDIEDMLKFQETDVLVPGTVYDFQDGELYKYENGGFFKLTSPQGFDPKIITELSALMDGKKLSFDTDKIQGRVEKNFTWNSNGTERDTFTFNNVNYIEDVRQNSWRSNATKPEEKEVVQEFKRIYGNADTTQIIFFKGSFYLRDANGKYQKLIKE